MFLTMKVLIDNESIDVSLFTQYTNAFTSEVKRAAMYLKRMGNPLNKNEISLDLAVCSRINVLKEGFRVSKLKRVSKNYTVSPIWNPASYELKQDLLILHFGPTFQKKQTTLRLLFTDYQFRRLKECVLRSVKIRRVDQFYYAYFTILVSEKKQKKTGITMGIDLGVRVPAVCVLSTGKVKFIGNGRHIRFLERSIKAKYKRYVKQRNTKALRKLNHKLSRKKSHLDHAYSRAIVNLAIAHNVDLIKMEKLKGLQEWVMKNQSKEIYEWSYHRFQLCIAHKARLEGIRIQYINPKNTSKKCPACGRLNTSKGRSYRCVCGFQKHRDLVGAINILNSTSLV